MITPEDIENKVFSSSLSGYKKSEVDEFLDQIMIDYQAMLDQNEKMLERVHVLQKQVAEMKDPARMTKDAKRLMNDISASAEQKAEVIIKNAKNDAANIVRNAKNSTSQADEDAERLRRKVEKFKLRFRQMLEEEIDKIDDNSEDLLEDLRKDFYPASLYGEEEQDATRVAGAAAEMEDPVAELPDVEPTGDIVPDEVSEEPEIGSEEEDEAPSEADAVASSEEASDETKVSVYEAEADEAEASEDPDSEEDATVIIDKPEFEDYAYRKTTDETIIIDKRS